MAIAIPNNHHHEHNNLPPIFARPECSPSNMRHTNFDAWCSPSALWLGRDLAVSQKDASSFGIQSKSTARPKFLHTRPLDSPSSRSSRATTTMSPAFKEATSAVRAAKLRSRKMSLAGPCPSYGCRRVAPEQSFQQGDERHLGKHGFG